MDFDIIPAHNKHTAFAQNEHGNSRWDFSTAATMTATGAVAGLAHAGAFNKKSGFLRNLANADIVTIEKEINNKDSAKARTAKKAVFWLKKAQSVIEGKKDKALEAADKLKDEYTKKAIQYLNKGTKPFGKAAAVGAIAGAGVYLFHKFFVGKGPNHSEFGEF